MLVGYSLQHAIHIITLAVSHQASHSHRFDLVQLSSSSCSLIAVTIPLENNEG